ncbi:MAG: dienelactone hydrolase family protein [Chloroflexota bacterium]
MDRVYVMQLVRSFQAGEMTRRSFLTKATAALGSLAAANVLLAGCQPVTPPPAEVVVEEDAAESAAEDDAGGDGSDEMAAAGLVTGMVEYPGGADDQALTGYLARPKSGDPAPIVIVIQEWWGLNEHIKDVTRRFADEGFVALAPDLYHGVVVSEPDEARKLVMALDMEAAVGEIQSAIDYLQGQDYVADAKAGVVGFCMGGRLVLATSLVEDDLGAGVVFYGSPLSPDQVGEVKAPLLGLYGDQDRGIPVEAVQAMDEALDGTDVEHEIYIYENAQHAFFNDTRESSYNAEVSADAWAKTLAWFSERL